MNKTRFALIVSLLLFLGSVISSLALFEQRAIFLRGWESATQPDTPLPFAVPHPGVNVELTQYDETELAVQLNDMVDFGVTWVRQTFSWAAIEPEPNVYHWEQWDRIVQAVAEHDTLRLVAVLNYSPEWARYPLAPDSPTAPPADTADFGYFTRLFAERYGDHIDTYQVWDEPNLNDTWGGLDPKAADYVALLQAAYTAIHNADETATVITAGLAPTTESGPRNYSEVLFLQAIYENGGAPYFDAVAGKPYGFDTGPDDRRVDPTVLNFSRIILLREAMVRYGDAHKSLWASHFGWNALPDDWDGPSSIWGEVSAEEQREYIQAAYERAAREWPWMGGMILRHWQPDAPDDDPQWGFSLISPGQGRVNIETPFFVSDITVATPGRHHPLSPAATYRGEWEFSELGADFGQENNSEVEFVFDGSALALELRRDSYRAHLVVTVDGQPANALPQDNNGQSYIILTSDDRQPHVDTVLVADQFSPGSHTVHIRAERGWDQWALAAFRVANPPDVSAYDLALGIMLFLGLTALLTVIALVRRAPKPITRPFWRPLFQPLGQATHFILGITASVLLMIGMLLTWQNAIPSLLRRDPPGLLLGLLTAGMLYFSESMLLTIFSGLLLFFLIYNRLELGLFLTILWAPFFLYPLELFQFAFPMAEVCVLLTAAAWLLQRLINEAIAYQKRPRTISQVIEALIGQLGKFNTLDWGILFLLVLAFISISWSAHQEQAWREWRTIILEPALFYLMMRTTIRTTEELTRLVDALILAACLSAIIGIGLFLTGQGIITAEGDTPRLAGVYGSPNNVGLFMGRAIPFALAFVVLATKRSRRLLAGLASAVMLVAVALSQSIGAILLGLPVGIVVVLLLWNTRRAIIATISTVIGGLLALIPLSQTPRFARLLDFSSGTSFFRTRLWQSALQMIQERPIQGYGLDQFLYQYRGRFILPDAWQEPDLSHPHNIILDFWTRLGLGGVLLLVWLQIGFWRTSWQLYKAQRLSSPVLRAINMGMMGSMAALLAHGLVDNSVFVLDLSYTFALLIALPSLLTATNVAKIAQIGNKYS